MGDRSKIEWTDATWNPVRAKNPATGKLGHHCVKISPACLHCYAARQNKWTGTGLDYVATSPAEMLLDVDALFKPFSWKRPRRIFPCSMTDLFLDGHSEASIDALFAVMYAAQWHTFQVLTKRPERMHEHLSNPGRAAAIGSAAYEIAVRLDPRKVGVLTRWDVVTDVECMWPLPNVQLGVTAEDQPHLDKRLPWLLKTPAAVRFLSIEPLLGPLDIGLRNWAHIGSHRDDCRIDWVIVGGESGPQARPMHPAWARLIRDDCQDAGVPFFFKQWGEYVPLIGEHKGGRWDGAAFSQTEAETPEIPERKNGYVGWEFPDGQVCMRVGKKYAGRLLDGRTWDEFPATEVHA